MPFNPLSSSPSQQQTDQQRVEAIRARMAAGAPVSPVDVQWLASKGRSSGFQASPYSYFNPSTSSWASTPSPTPTPTPSPPSPAPVIGEPRDFWTQKAHPEYTNLYETPTIPTGWEIESITKTSTGAPEIRLKLTNIEAALASGQTLPSEVMESYQAKKKYDVDVAKSKGDWTKLGYAQYGGKYTAPNVPSGFVISDITESGTGLNIQYRAVNAKGYMKLAKTMTSAQLDALQADLMAPTRAQDIGQRMVSGGSVNAKEAIWLGKNFPDYASQVFIARQSGARAGGVGAKIAGGGYVSAKDVLWLQSAFPGYAKQVGEVNLSTQRANLIGQSYLAGGAFSAKEAVWLGRNYPGYGQALFELRGERANVIASKSFSSTSTAETETVSADEYFNRIYTQSTKNKGEILSVPVELKEQYASWVISKGFWSEKGSGHYFPELAGKYAPLGAEELGALSGGWQIEKMTETPEGVSVAWKQPPKSITQQISEFKVSDVGLLRGFLTEEHQARADVLISEGKVVPQFVKPLASLELVFAPVESVVLGIAHLVAKGIGKDNPYFAAQPPATPFSAGVGLLTGSSAGVGELGKLELSEVIFRGLGDIWALAPTAKLAVDLEKRGASRLATKIEVWRYGAEGSEKWMESIRAGTIVNPETGMTTYTGFAAKQASRLSPGIVSLPFGTTKSLSRILSGVSEETAMGAMDFSMDLTMTPHASAFSISKLANPAYIRSSLPVYQMIGGALVNVSEMATSWGDPNAKFKMFPETKTAIERTSIQSDFEQLGFKNVVTPKETPFTGFRDIGVGYSGSASQKLYMKASNVVSEVKSMFADKSSAARLDQVFNMKSHGFMETSVQGIKAGVNLPSARLIGINAVDSAYTGAVLPVFGSYTATKTEKAFIKTQNEAYGKSGYGAQSNIVVSQKLSSVFAFPTSVGAFPVIPDITMSRQSTRLETKQSNIEEYLGLSTKQFQSQVAGSFYKTPTVQVSQLTRLKSREGTTYMPKIADFLGEREGLDLGMFPALASGSVLIAAQASGLKQISLTGQGIMMKSGFASSFGFTPPDIFGTIPGVPPGVPFTFPKLGGAGSGGGGRGGYGKWFKMTRPILEPKQVWSQFWGRPKLSVSRVGARGKRHKVSVTRVGPRKKRSRRKK